MGHRTRLPIASIILLGTSALIAWAAWRFGGGWDAAQQRAAARPRDFLPQYQAPTWRDDDRVFFLRDARRRPWEPPPMYRWGDVKPRPGR